MRLREKAHACEFEATCDERILEHCIQTITNQDLIKRAISKGWNLDKFVEEAGQMEDTCLQMKDMKGDPRDIDISDYDEDEDYFGETIKHIMKIRKVKTIQGIRDMEQNSDGKNRRRRCEGGT
ncbi:Hypothetical predicted protein [Mytilus galloprovincialis]|uniref:Uncharacterized protein n=1 Tax=Mytilus galloprovincialis TaxID=29158 RepID=A0A8B6GPR2_MYTGA|nr:Hypothetical predicted protein [Mytilus galloprovincialis]